jgi:hypothetical protein
LPVFFWNEEKGIVGIAHAGWKGMLAGVVRETLKNIEKEYGVDPSRLNVKLGPCIRTCHHVVDESHPDLPKTAREHVISLGVLPENITDTGVCTFCSKDKYYSLRRDRSETWPRGKGNMLSVIGYHE